MNTQSKPYKSLKPTFFIALIFVFTFSLFCENRALLIGIGNYNHPALNLKGPARDVSLMEEIVVKIGFKRNQVKTLINSQATRGLILNEFEEWLIKGVGATDKILFYYSGHGAQVVDKDNDEDDGCDEALVPFDITISPKAMIIDDEIKNLINRVNAKEMLIILDSCYSGTATRGLPRTRSSSGNLFSIGKMVIRGNCRCNQPVNRRSLSIMDTKGMNQEKYILISAAAQNEVAQAAVRMGEGSVFTQGLYEIVKNEKNVLTFSDLRDSVSQKVREKTSRFNRPCHTPQLEVNTTWFNKNFLEFAFKDMEQVQEQAYDGGIQHATSNTELFNRIINKRHFAVEIKSEKGTFPLGERIEFTIHSSKDGYLNIVELDPGGNIVVLFPNKFSVQKDISNKVDAWQNIIVPGSIGGFKFNAIEPVGTNRVIAIVTRKSLDLYREGVEKMTGSFRSISNKEHNFLKYCVCRAIGISEDNEKPPESPAMPEESNVEFGAGDILIKTVR